MIHVCFSAAPILAQGHLVLPLYFPYLCKHNIYFGGLFGL